MAYDFLSGLEDFYGGLADPDGLARRKLTTSGMPATLDDKGSADLYRGLANRSVAERYAVPYDMATTRGSREDLARAIEGMAKGSRVSELAGQRSGSRLQEQGGAAMGGAVSPMQRLAIARNIGDQAGQIADQTGQGAAQEEQQKQAMYGQSLEQMAAGDLQVRQSLIRADAEQQSKMVGLQNQMLHALDIIEQSQAGAKIDYDGLLRKISDEARAGSVNTLMQLAQIAGTIAMTVATGGAASPAAAGAIAGAIGGK